MKKICFLACAVLAGCLFHKQLGSLLGNCLGRMITKPLADAIANGAVVTVSVGNFHAANAQNKSTKEPDAEDEET